MALDARLPVLLDLDGIAGHLGVSPRHVRRLVAERRIPFLKWGHLLRFDPDEIARWLDECRVRPSSVSHPTDTVPGDEPARGARRRGSVSQRTSAASTAL